MKWIDILKHRMASFRSARRQSELKRELEHHFSARVADLRVAGMSEADAKREAAREFGASDRFEEECRDAWGLRWWQDFCRDVALAWRRMRQQRVFSAAIILTFALGIGLNTVMFRIFDSLWLNPELYPDEDRVVRIFDVYEGGVATAGQTLRGTSPQFYRERAEQSQLVEAMGLTMPLNGTVTMPDAGLRPEYVDWLGITSSMFEVLRVPPLLGRVFEEADEQPGADGVTILYHDYWVSRFHSDPEVIGKTLFTDGRPRKIVGVMPKDFVVPEVLHLTDGTAEMEGGGEKRRLLLPYGPRIWPEWLNTPERRHSVFNGSFARLKPGVASNQLRDELNAINVRNGALLPEQFEFEQRHGHRTEVATIQQDLIRESRSMLFLLQGALGVVLTIGCVNIVSLILSRNCGRRQEFALRMSLGAGRSRLARQLVTEMWLLALIGGVVGLGLAAVGLQGLEAAGVFKFFVVPPRVDIDWRVLGFALSLASVAGIAAGLGSLVPLWQDRRLGMAMADDARTGSAGPDAKRFRASLLAAEVMFTIILLVGGSLLLRSFAQIVAIDPGFETTRLLTGVVRLPQDRYDREGTIRFISEFEARLQEMPSVEAAGISNWPPLKVTGIWENQFIRPQDEFAGRDMPTTSGDAVGMHYFEALGIEVLRGRVFNAGDYGDGPPVAVIDRRVAETHFAGEDPIGQLIAVPPRGRILSVDAELQWLRVVGVVEAIRVENLLGYPTIGGTVYQTYRNRVPYWVGFLVRTEGDPVEMLDPVRDLLEEMEPTAAAGLTETMDAVIKRRYGDQKTFLVIGLYIATVALIICAVGVYGMLAHAVASQEKEIAIRRALGAMDGTVMNEVMGYWMGAAAVGLFIGLAGALALSGLLGEWLYQVGSSDPVSYAAAVAVLGGAVVMAAITSARRAASLSMSEVLRR